MTVFVGSVLIQDNTGKIFGFSLVTLVALAAGAIILGGACWDIVNNLIKRFYGRNWPTISASHQYRKRRLHPR